MALVKYNNNSITDITTAGQVAIGSLVPIKTLTASSSATLSFVHGTDGVVLDSTYPIYKFEFINMHPQNDDAFFHFNVSIDGGSNYNVAKTSSYFFALQNEAGTSTNLAYESNYDLAQNTYYQSLGSIGNDNDQSLSGSMTLFSPSSTTFVKHYMATINRAYSSDFTINEFISGYANTTSAVNAIRFQMNTYANRTSLSNSGNIDSGKIKLYGIKDS